MSGIKTARQKRGFHIIVGSSSRKDRTSRPSQINGEPIHNVQSVRARIRARVQRLYHDERRVRGREKIWGQVHSCSHGGSRARLPEPAEDYGVFVDLEVPGALGVMESIR